MAEYRTFDYSTKGINLDTTKPSEDVTEAQKYADNGMWFKHMARHIVKEFYNRQMAAFGDTLRINNGGGMKFSNRYVDDMTENMGFYFGQQENNTFAALAQTPMGNSVPAHFIPGQKIFQVISSMEGNVQEMIQPLKKSISGISLSQDTVDEKMSKINRIRLAGVLKKEMENLKAIGMEFDPGTPDFDTQEEATSHIENIRHDYEINAVNDARAIHYKNALDVQFLYDFIYQANCGISGSEIHEVGGEVTHTMIPSQYLIWDHRAKDPYFSDGLVCGKIEWLSPMEVFDRFPEAFSNPKDRDMVQAVANSSTEAKAFMEYLNNTANYPNIVWWNQSDGKIAVATVYWLSKKNLRYRVKQTSHGIEFPVPIDDTKIYDLPDGSRKKGADIKGDDSVWWWHKCSLVGNFWACNYGYEKWRIKGPQRKAIPAPPIEMWAHRLLGGHIRPIVSRTKDCQKLIDIYRVKVQEMVASAKSKNYIIRGAALGEGEDAIQIAEDFAQMNISVVTGTSGIPGTPGADGKLAELVDLTLDPNVQMIIQLSQLAARDIEEIASTNPIALGGTGNSQYMSQGVQQGSIMQSTKGQRTLYDGLMEFWRRKYQHSINLSKLIKTEDGESEEAAQVAPGEVAVLKYTKGYRNDDILMFIEPNDTIEGRNEALLQQMLQAYGQNPEVGYEPLLNALKIMTKPTFREAVTELERFAKVKKVEQQKAVAQDIQVKRQMAAEQQGVMAAMDRQKFIENIVSEIMKAAAKGAFDNQNAVKAPIPGAQEFATATLQRAAGISAEQQAGAQSEQSVQGAAETAQPEIF